MSRRPHIVIFNPDQYRWDVQRHLGNAAAVSPNLDRLVRHEAVSFRQAFCQNTVCTPSRCSFMTGWYPHVRGHRTMYHMLHPELGEPVLLKTLKDAGYRVWWGGKNDLIPATREAFAACCDVHVPPIAGCKPLWMEDQSARWRGPKDGDSFYSFYVGRLDTGGERIYHDVDWAWVEAAIEYIRTAPQDKPLCIYLPLIYPHPAFAVEEPWYSMIDRAKLPPRVPPPADWRGKPSMVRGLAERQRLLGWSDDRWAELRGTYYGMCARIDHQLGMVVQALKDAGIYDDTALFFFSDHGEFAGDYGIVEKTQNTFEDAISRVPLVVKPPATLPVRPRVTDALVELVDFPATVLELAGIVPDWTHFGRSLLPVLAGQREEHRDAVFCEGGRRHGERHCMEADPEALDKDGIYWPRASLQASEGPEHTRAFMCRTHEYKYVYRLYESDELYDLRGDPGERHNRIDDPALAPVRTALRDRLLRHFAETADVVPLRLDRRGD